MRWDGKLKSSLVLVSCIFLIWHNTLLNADYILQNNFIIIPAHRMNVSGNFALYYYNYLLLCSNDIDYILLQYIAVTFKRMETYVVCNNTHEHVTRHLTGPILQYYLVNNLGT